MFFAWGLQSEFVYPIDADLWAHLPFFSSLVGGRQDVHLPRNVCLRIKIANNVSSWMKIVYALSYKQYFRRDAWETDFEDSQVYCSWCQDHL